LTIPKKEDKIPIRGSHIHLHIPRPSYYYLNAKLFTFPEKRRKQTLKFSSFSYHVLQKNILCYKQEAIHIFTIAVKFTNLSKRKALGTTVHHSHSFLQGLT
ncbi:hypothetical protein TorRG33x02_222860, partial [Trema orientale]